MSIAQQYRRVATEVADECRACGRDARDVTLIAVSKTVEVPAIAEAIDAGATDLGENRPDRLLATKAAYPDANWHFIGNLQSRRIDDVVSCASLIHSVYKADHLPKLAAAAAAHDKVQDILLEVNVSGEESKSGAEPDEVGDLFAAASKFDSIRVLGLMTMAPRSDDDLARETFEGLARLRDRLRGDFGIDADSSLLSELSMGMSDDWRQAVACGATMVRIGRAVFSDEYTERA